jgi:predicted RNA-binding protein YlxR (DUF448 family)
MPRTPRTPTRSPARTCVACGVCDGPRAAAGLLRVVATPTGLEVDLRGRARGRGAYVHARPACLDGAHRGLVRALGSRVAEPSAAAADLRGKLVAACNRRMAALLGMARRLKSVAIGEPRSHEAFPGRSVLTIVAADAGAVAYGPGVQRAVAEGRAVVWGCQHDLGALLGESDVACCTVSHEGLAAELMLTRAAADAAMAATKQTTQRSRRPEAR